MFLARSRSTPVRTKTNFTVRRHITVPELTRPREFGQAKLKINPTKIRTLNRCSLCGTGSVSVVSEEVSTVPPNYFSCVKNKTNCGGLGHRLCLVDKQTATHRQARIVFWLVRRV